MSRSYGKVQTSYHTHPKIRSFAFEDARWLGLYLLTSRHSNSIGSYALPWAYAVDDLQWTRERFELAFAELAAKNFAQRFTVNSEDIVVCDHFQWNAPENPNVLKNMVDQFDLLPKDVLRIHPLAGIVATGPWVPARARDRLRSLLEELRMCFREHFGKGFESQAEPEPSRTEPQPQPNLFPTNDPSVAQSPRAREPGENGLNNEGSQRPAPVGHLSPTRTMALQDRVAAHTAARAEAEQRRKNGGSV